MRHVARQKATADQVDPFPEKQIEAFLRQAARSKYPRRDEALICVSLDSGIRASELCNLRMEDVHLFDVRATVPLLFNDKGIKRQP